MKKGVLRPGHLQLRVLDLEAAITHYTDVVGLIEMDRDDQGRVYLKGWTEVDKFSVVLVEADEPGADFMGFKVVDEAALVQLERDLVAHGVEIEHLPAGELKDCGRRIRFCSPSGHRFELYADKQYTGKWGIDNVNPEAWPRGLAGMKAMRFDHCLFFGDQLDETLTLFVDVLGFFLTEQVVDGQGSRLAQFLSLSTKAHDIAFIHYPEKGRLHHVSFLLDNWQEVLYAADLLSITDTSIDISPTRHGLTHGQTTYFFDPSGNRNEAFCEGNYVYPDHAPVTWTADQLGKAIFYHDKTLKEAFVSVVT